MRWVTATGGTIELVDAFSVEENVPCPVDVIIGNEDKFTGSWPREGQIAHTNSGVWDIPIRVVGGSKIEWLDPRYEKDYSEEHVLYPFLKSNGAHRLRVRVLEWPWTLRIAESSGEPSLRSQWIRNCIDRVSAGATPVSWGIWCAGVSGDDEYKSPVDSFEGLLTQIERGLSEHQRRELRKRYEKLIQEADGQKNKRVLPPPLPGVGGKGHRIMDGGE